MTQRTNVFRDYIFPLLMVPLLIIIVLFSGGITDFLLRNEEVIQVVGMSDKDYGLLREAKAVLIVLYALLKVIVPTYIIILISDITQLLFDTYNLSNKIKAYKLKKEIENIPLTNNLGTDLLFYTRYSGLIPKSIGTVINKIVRSIIKSNSNIEAANVASNVFLSKEYIDAFKLLNKKYKKIKNTVI